MNTQHFHNVVVGAGAVGTAAAYHLARRGERFALVEQFALGHARGSSHGSARIIRHSYASEDFARLMPLAFQSWRELEADASQPLYLRTGGISVCPPGVGYVQRATAHLEALGVVHRRMSGGELRHALPVFGCAEDCEVVFEPDAGILAASRILRLQVDLARHHGGHNAVVLENCPVTRLDLEGEKPTLVTEQGAITADRLIVAAGPWTSRLVPNLPVRLRATRQQILYFRPPDPTAYAPGRFPVFIYQGSGELDAYYGMPAYGGLGVKVARHGGPAMDPDHADTDIHEDYRGVIRAFLWRFLPDLVDCSVGHHEVCVYNMAPDERFLLGALPGRSDVVVASPCSGHGFKFSNLMGRMLVELAIDGQFSLPDGPWRIGLA